MALEKRLDITKKFSNKSCNSIIKLFVDDWRKEEVLNLLVANVNKEEGVSIALTEDQVEDFIEVLKVFVVEPEGEEGDDEHR